MFTLGKCLPIVEIFCLSLPAWVQLQPEIGVRDLEFGKALRVQDVVISSAAKVEHLLR